MKLVPNCLARAVASISLGLGLPFAGILNAQISTLLDCPNGTVGDFVDRGFYVTNYPGTSINGVTVYMSVTSGSWPYQIGLTVTEGTFDGPVVADYFTSATLTTTEKAVSIQMVSPPPQQTNPPVTPGSTLCFKFYLNQQPGSPTPVYAVDGPIGVDLPDSTDPCLNVVQTTGTTPPLSTFRREGVKLQITGNKFLNPGPGQSIQLAIDNADPGDVVTVAAGTYNEELTLRSGIDVIGAGRGLTILEPSDGQGVEANGVTNTELSGFTIQPAPGSTATTGIRISGGSPSIRNNHVTGFPNYGIRVLSSSTAFLCGNCLDHNFDPGNGFLDYNLIILNSTPLVTNNLITAGEVGCYIARHASDGMQFLNNTVADNTNDGIWCYQSNPVLKNNLVTGNAPGISASHDNATPQLTYNNVWGNSVNYSAQQTGVINVGIGSISANPDYDGAMYLLSETSPCIDAGDPAAIYNDLDGSRNDIGYTGGPCGSSTPPGTILEGFVWTSVGTIATADIEQGAGAKRGLTLNRDRPFGGAPWLFGAFGTNESSVYRYAVKVAKWTGGTPPPAGAFEYVDQPLSKVRYDISGGTLTTSTVALGPLPLGGKPSYLPTVNSGNIFWAHENLRVVLNTLVLENGVHSVRIERLDIFGNEIPLTVNNDLILHVNNTWPVVSIDAVSSGGGAPFDECSIIDLPGATSTLDFVYTASHADGFLDNYTLTALVGRNRSGGNIATGTYTSVPSAFWSGEVMTPVAATPLSPEQALPNLQLWETCAYQFRITAWARTTNGFGRIYHDTFFDNYAIDLEPPVLCTPDLDGDGDVDGDDLEIMAAALGSN